MLELIPENELMERLPEPQTPALPQEAVMLDRHRVVQ